VIRKTVSRRRFKERAREFAHRVKCGDYRDALQPGQ